MTRRQRWRQHKVVILAAAALATAACDARDRIEDPPCDGLCVDVLASSSRQPFVVGFDMRLRVGTESIKEGVTAENFSIAENGRPLDLSETNQFVRSGEGLPMKIMLVLDYTNSMAEASRIGPMITAASAFVEPSPFVNQDDLALIEIRHSNISTADRVLVSDFFPGNCDTRERVSQGTLNPHTNLCALGNVWDAVGLAMLKLDLEQETRNRVVVFITDGQDEFPTAPAKLCIDPTTAAVACPQRAAGTEMSCPVDASQDGALQEVYIQFDNAQAVIDQATAGDNGVRLVPVGFGNTFRQTEVLAAMASSTDGLFVQADVLDGLDGLHASLTEVGVFLRGLQGPINVVLVLDYTVNASQGDILALIDAVRAFVQPEHFNATQQIGVVEFHDRTGQNEGFAQVVPLTSADCEGRAAILNGIPGPGTLEYGQTRLWDAVSLGLTHLTEAAQAEALAGAEQPRLALVFLTDGNDTTSVMTADLVLLRALANRVAVFPIDFGEITDDSTAFGELLDRLARTSGGRYFAAEDTVELQRAFRDIAEELRGQWSLTYVTQKNIGAVDVDITFGWNQELSVFHYLFDAASIDGEIHTGNLEVFDCREGQDDVTCRVRARYIPRNINRFRFRLPAGAEFRPQGSGGLTPPSNGWEVCHRDNGRCVDVVRRRSPRHDNTTEQRDSRPELLLEGDPLQYGIFGNLGTIKLPKAALAEQIELLRLELQGRELQQPQPVQSPAVLPLVMPMTHDDTIYEDLPQPKRMDLAGAVMPLVETDAGDPCDCPCREDPTQQGQGCTSEASAAALSAQSGPGNRRERPHAAAGQSEPAERRLRQDDRADNGPRRSRTPR